MKQKTKCPSCKKIIDHLEKIDVESFWTTEDGRRFSDGHQACYCCPECAAILGVSPSLLSDIEGYTGNTESDLRSLKSSFDGLKKAVEKLGGGDPGKKA
jgi:hypothetical protein